MPAVSDVTDSPGSDHTLLISASSKHQGGESLTASRFYSPQLSKQTGAGWECRLGSGNQSSYLVLKLPAALPGPSLHSDFPVLDSGQDRADPALKVGARSRGCRPEGLRALRQSPRCTFGANLGAAATVHLAPATRRSFQRRRTQPRGTRGRAPRTVRGPAVVLDSRGRSALLCSPRATSREKGSCPCHLASASACPGLGDPMRQAPRDGGQRAAESGEPRPWSPAHASAVTAPGPRRHLQGKQQRTPVILDYFQYQDLHLSAVDS